MTPGSLQSRPCFVLIALVSASLLFICVRDRTLFQRSRPIDDEVQTAHLPAFCVSNFIDVGNLSEADVSFLPNDAESLTPVDDERPLFRRLRQKSSGPLRVDSPVIVPQSSPFQCTFSPNTSIVIIIAESLTDRTLTSVWQLRQRCMDAHIVLSVPVPPSAEILEYVHHVPNTSLVAAGFINVTTFSPITAWDGALLWAYWRRSSLLAPRYQWFVEEDVAWFPESALVDLIQVRNWDRPPPPL
jgi:hypothetical protein